MKTPKTKDKKDERPFKCSFPDAKHVRRRRNGRWYWATSCAGDHEHADVEVHVVMDGYRGPAVWRRGDLRDVPALRGKRETGHAFDQVL